MQDTPRRTGRQLGLPGVMPLPPVEVARPSTLRQGQEVVYIGRVPGGPSRGVWGRVQRLTPRGAWVHFGPAGSWLVPHHLLGIPRPVEVSPFPDTEGGTP
ncbi:MAG: hypothetical protein NZ951_04845 [Dehalococcoidia bacterium]|nr:hypothetical protein [Dehalococcoidia bacterium]MDW8120152.1 hypothetical protein [Chloroflexota bacterium]